MATLFSLVASERRGITLQIDKIAAFLLMDDVIQTILLQSLSVHPTYRLLLN